VGDVLDHGVGSREEQADVPVVVPTHDIRGTTVVAPHLEDLGVPIGLTDMVALDDQSITYCCLHGTPP